MTEKFTGWDPVDHRMTDIDQRMYLSASLEEDPGDGSLVRAALGDIARARGVPRFALDSGTSLEALYRALAQDESWGCSMIERAIRALDMRLHAS